MSNQVHPGLAEGELGCKWGRPVAPGTVRCGKASAGAAGSEHLPRAHRPPLPAQPERRFCLAELLHEQACNKPHAEATLGKNHADSLETKPERPGGVQKRKRDGPGLEVCGGLSTGCQSPPTPSPKGLGPWGSEPPPGRDPQARHRWNHFTLAGKDTSK